MVAALGDDPAEQRQAHRLLPQPDEIGRRGVGGVLGRVGHAVEVREAGRRQAHRAGRRVHLRDERVPAGAVAGGQQVGRVAAGGQQHRLQQLARGQHIPGDQAGAAGTALVHVPDGAPADLDLPAQVTGPDHQQRGHHLGDAAHRPGDGEVPAPQFHAGAGIHQPPAPGVHPRRPGVRHPRRGRPQAPVTAPVAPWRETPPARPPPARAAGSGRGPGTWFPAGARAAATLAHCIQPARVATAWHLTRRSARAGTGPAALRP